MFVLENLSEKRRKTPDNIYDGGFCSSSKRLLIVSYCCKALSILDVCESLRYTVGGRANILTKAASWREVCCYKVNTFYRGLQIFKIFFYIGAKNFIPVFYRYILSENNKIIVS